jgi:hypothetical protein
MEERERERGELHSREEKRREDNEEECCDSEEEGAAQTCSKFITTLHSLRIIVVPLI